MDFLSSLAQTVSSFISKLSTQVASAEKASQSNVQMASYGTINQYAKCIAKWREETGDYSSSDTQVLQRLRAEILRRDPMFFHRVSANAFRIHQTGLQQSDAAFQATQAQYRQANHAQHVEVADCNSHYQETMDHVSELQTDWIREQQDYTNPDTGSVYKISNSSPGSFYAVPGGEEFYHSQDGTMYELGPLGEPTEMNPHYGS